MIRLNLGCGDWVFPGWTNVDLYDPKADLKCDVKKLPYEDNTVDQIYNCHIIEHFHFHEAFDVLREWNRVLKPGGLFEVETCDFLASCKKFIESDEKGRVEMYGHFFAKPWFPGQTHYFLYTETQLRWTLEKCGFKNIVRVPALRYIGMEEVCLKLAATK
jgi:ubiquinone/menaquinone biosynthesis C-methylase UbiE